jgi:hypothetical protein
METKTITIRVNAEVARIFETASEEQRRKDLWSNQSQTISAAPVW